MKIAKPRIIAQLTSLQAIGRERAATPASVTLCFLLLAACGGRHHGDTYAKATSTEQVCCEHLSGEGRDRCLQQIVRVDDPEVERSSINQTQYACIEDHFVCDPQTGHATAASAQQQLDCLQDIK